MPIGGVLATKGVVVPNAVGVDIGCGMCAARTNIIDMTPDVLKAIVGKIRESIPVGFKHHDRPMFWEGFDDCPDIPILRQELKSARYQLGTLGGGNHFIEIQKGGDGKVWVMLHSGSRNFGYKIANHYHEVAKKLCEKWHSDLPHKDLAFLPLDSGEGQEYLCAMQYALDFAQANRDFMLAEIEEVLGEVAEVRFKEIINIHHNYATMEHHFGENVLVHRKGATSAKKDQLGIIPGSQGTRSYIVLGKGNPESFMSCSHGAGRRMGRAQAKRELSVEAEAKALDAQGILHSIRGVDDLDEAPSAYKDIDLVMKNQEDLVEISVTLRPLAVIKG